MPSPICKELLKKYGGGYPRKTRVTSFESVEARELATREFSLKYDKDKGYVGIGVDGEPQCACSAYDKILMVWGDGRYKVVPPLKSYSWIKIWCLQLSRTGIRSYHRLYGRPGNLHKALYFWRDYP